MQIRVASYLCKKQWSRIYIRLFRKILIHDIHSRYGHSARISNSIFLPFPKVEAIRINFKYLFIKIWIEVPTNILSFVHFLQKLQEIYNRFLPWSRLSFLFNVGIISVFFIILHMLIWIRYFRRMGRTYSELYKLHLSLTYCKFGVTTLLQVRDLEKCTILICRYNRLQL